MNCRRLKYVKDGTVLHVCNRGVLKKPIFLDDFDYTSCEEILGESAEKYGIPIFAYCLMPNHWHLLVEAPTGELLTRMLQRFSSVHARNLRKRQENQGTGAVYQSRYRAHAVQKNEVFSKVQKYIEENPVKAGLCPSPKDWRWSSACPDAKQIRVSKARLWIPAGAPILLENSWHTRIESALFLQSPLGEPDWRSTLLASSQTCPKIEPIAA